jgi:hypothetical protein
MIKDEIFRMLDPRWHFYGIVRMRQAGFAWGQIAKSFKYHQSTVKTYFKRGKSMLELEDTLHFHLSTRASNLLFSMGIDPKEPMADVAASEYVRSYNNVVVKYGGFGIGRITRDEILNAIDELNNARTNRRSLAGE